MRKLIFIPGALIAVMAATLFLTLSWSSGAVAAGHTPQRAAVVAHAKHVVTIKTSSSSQFVFSPSKLSIKVGATVTWRNKSGTFHTITSDNGKWRSKNINPNKSVSIKFKKAGTYKYHCAIHPFMKGKIVVHK